MRLLSSMTLSAGIKVLALHGKGGSGPAMARNLQPLVEATKADNWAWSFPSAPHYLEAFTAQGNVKQTTFKTGTAWWQLPPGVRSFEASEFEGVEESKSGAPSAKKIPYSVSSAWDRVKEAAASAFTGGSSGDDSSGSKRGGAAAQGENKQEKDAEAKQ